MATTIGLNFTFLDLTKYDLKGACIFRYAFERICEHVSASLVADTAVACHPCPELLSTYNTLCCLCDDSVKLLNEIPFKPRSACFPRFPTHWMSDTRTANGTHTQERKFRLCLVAPFKLYLVAPSLSHPWRRPFDRTELLHEV